MYIQLYKKITNKQKERKSMQPIYKKKRHNLKRPHITHRSPAVYIRISHFYLSQTQCISYEHIHKKDKTGNQTRQLHTCDMNHRVCITDSTRHAQTPNHASTHRNARTQPNT